MEIIIEGFPSETYGYEIMQAFKKYGSVSQVRKNKVRNKAIVTMPHRNQAQKAIKKIDGTEFFGRIVRVRVKRN